MQPDWANLQQFVFTSNLVIGKSWNSASFKAYQKWKHRTEADTLISKWAGLNQLFTHKPKHKILIFFICFSYLYKTPW